VTRREPRSVAEEARPANHELLALANLFEELVLGDVDETNAAAHELEGAHGRQATRRGARDVEDDAHTALEQLLSRHAIDVLLIDDGDVVRP
jgi:hypothetical protein